MKVKKYNPVFERDEMLKIQNFGDGYSGFVRPGNTYNIGCLNCFGESKIYVTNTGLTDLKFHLSGNESFHNNGNHLILQPGELITIEVDPAKSKPDGFIHVTNIHVEMQGSFVIAVYDTGRKKPETGEILIRQVDN